MKPWEETWMSSERYVILNDGNTFGTPVFPSEAHAQLAAAAPDMARVLLLQHAAGICPSCGDYREQKGHNHDCTVEAALRKAGVLP